MSFLPHISRRKKSVTFYLPGRQNFFFIFFFPLRKKKNKPAWSNVVGSGKPKKNTADLCVRHDKFVSVFPNEARPKAELFSSSLGNWVDKNEEKILTTTTTTR